MTSKIVVNNIEADAGVSTVFFNSDIGATGGTLNVDGNLNVDGVITYEDVTSVDSVGLITARNGIHVTGGSVGIGTNNPDEKLEVYGGNIQQYNLNASGGTGLILQNYADGGGGNTTPYSFIRAKSNPIRNAGEIRFGRDSAYGSAAEADSHISFWTALNDTNTERLRINSAGKVGINTTNPTSIFDVETGTGSGINFDSSGANTPTLNFMAGAVRLESAAQILVGENNGGGDFLIKTKSTGGTLTTRVTVDNSGLVKLPDNGKLIFGNGSDFEIYHDGSNSIINDSGTGNLQLQTAGTTRLTSTSTGVNINGNVGVQTTYPTSSTLVGAASSLIGLYIGDGHMLFSDNLSRSGGYYIPNGINALNAGPVTLNSTMTLDGVWVIV